MTYEKTCHKVLFYEHNNFLQFDLSQCLCTRYHDIWKIGGNNKNKLDWVVKDAFCYLRNEQLKPTFSVEVDVL